MGETFVSFVITSFNQKDYICEAIKGAFAQTYSPLEIIVADDYSTDGSELVIQKLVNDYKYRGGRHQVVVRRNRTNLGVLRNCEDAFSRARGELIVLGGGDDISHPDRVEKIVRAWMLADKKPTVIFHGVNLIGIDGKQLSEEFWRPTIRNPLGAAMAFSPVVVRNFPASVETRGYEDNVFARRAYAFGETLYIDEKLVDYRQGAGSTTAGAHVDRRKRISRAMFYAAKQNLIDLDAVIDKVDKVRVDEIREMLTDCMEQYGFEFEMLTGKTLLRRYLAFRHYVRHPMCLLNPNFHNFIVYYLPILLPVCAVPLELIRKVYRYGKRTLK